MRTARMAIGNVRTQPVSPSYMSMKQSRDEPFGKFVDRVTSAIDQSDVPEWMKGAILRQCIYENTNPETKAIILSLPGDATVEMMLDRLSRVPVGRQAMLVEAVRELGKDLIQAQQQAFAALAPLHQPETRPRSSIQSRSKCFRCGQEGHMRRHCRVSQVWCENCQVNNHSTSVCKRTGNGQASASGCRARTTIAAPALQTPSTEKQSHLPVENNTNPFLQSPCNQPQKEASGWTWQQQ